MQQILQERILIFQRVLNEIPDVQYVGNPILRKQTETVEIDEGRKIGDRLGTLLIQYRQIAGIGRGLAAPQIGLNKAVFVTYVEDELKTFINPRILQRSPQTNFYRELCLSCGIMAADVERPSWITMECLDTAGVLHNERFEGFLARLYQHEEAHLRGIVNIDEATVGGIELATFDPLQEVLRESR